MLAETGIHFWDTETGRKGDILKKNDQRTFGYGHFQISPNGKKVIYVAHDTSAQSQPFCKCHIWEIDNLRRVSSSEIRFTFCERPQIALSPNEESYGIWSEASTVIEIRSFTNSQLQRRTLTRGVKLVKFTPDNKQVYILTAVSESQSTKSNNYIWDIQQDDLKEFGPERDVMAADTSQDGRLLALSFGSDSSTIEVYSVYSTALLHSIKLDFWNFSLQFSPSGTHFTTDRGTVMMPGESPPPSPQLFASESWIQENGQDILAMPSPYRGALIDIKGHTILFRDFPNEPVIVRLDQGCKSMTS
ncbi:hypothetical protein N7481_007106 [Penicillium waksmanii]|uniref:uncharacterized protein n=1 Tax=Penicillium waksmanii TaxID=69791 RepID=UPI002548E1C4|nr:uncharacterized protein N7481_007106 [Penicillium waksmanii]KAJ5979808.1 hypothetical protein N7481_007106 [Penicillium waksmanii]